MRKFAKQTKVKFNKYKVQKNVELDGTFNVVDAPIQHKTRKSSIRNIYGVVSEKGLVVYTHFRNLILA